MTWQKMAGLTVGETLLLCETAASLALANVRLRFLPYRSLPRLSHDHAATGSQGVSVTSGTPAKIAWALGALARRMPGKNTCLVQALAAHAMLRRRGYPSELRIGVSGKDPAGKIKAHAWVECEGRVVVGDVRDLAAYSVLTPPASR